MDTYGFVAWRCSPSLHVRLFFSEFTRERMCLFFSSCFFVFSRKVYGIIALQLLMTTAVSAVFLFVEPIRVWMHLHGQPIIITAAGKSSVALLLSFFSLLDSHTQKKKKKIDISRRIARKL